MNFRVLKTPERLSRRWLADYAARGLHCGCGPHLRVGCLNTDVATITDVQGNESEWDTISLCDERYLYLRHDATRLFPLEDGAIDWVYSEHFIEHISAGDAIAWLAEMRRLLSPGGLIRISTPDLRKYAAGYCDPSGSFFDLHRQRLRELTGHEQPQGRAWMVNQIFYCWGHRWIYDLDEMVYAAAAAGFPRHAITEAAFRQGRDREVAELDFPVRNDESLYLEITNVPS